MSRVRIEYRGEDCIWHGGSVYIPVARVNGLEEYPRAVLKPTSMPWSSARSMLSSKYRSTPVLALLPDRDKPVMDMISSCDLTDTNHMEETIFRLMRDVAGGEDVEIPNEFISAVRYWINTNLQRC